MFAIYAKGLQQRWIGGDLCSATDAQRFVHTRHEKEQPHMRMLDDILQRVDLVVSRAVGNQPGSVCPNTATNPGGSSLGEVSARPLASAELQGPYVGISVLLIFSVGKNVDPSIRSLVMECSFEITLPLGVFAVSGGFCRFHHALRYILLLG